MKSSEELNKKPSVAFKVFKFLMLTLFPGVKILATNKLLTVCGEIDTIVGAKGKIYPHPYFARQRNRNWLVAILVSLPLFLGAFGGYSYMSSNPIFNKAKTASVKQLKKFNLVEAVNKISIAKKIDPNLGKDIQVGLYMTLGGLAASVIFGFVVLNFNRILKETEILKQSLIQQGIIKEDELKDSLILATPRGYLVKLTSNTPREVEENQRIWMPLNIKVRDFAQHPQEISLVFFKKAYQLKKGGDYGFNTK